MVRQLLVPAFLALLLVPDWATAFHPCPPPVYLTPCTPTYGRVIVSGPVVVTPAVFGPAQMCSPAVGTVATPSPSSPTIVPERMQPVKPTPPQTGTGRGQEVPAKAEELAQPQPAEKTPMPQKPADPTPMTPPPADPTPADPTPRRPQPEQPKVIPPTVPERIPPQGVPPMPPAKEDLPKFDLDALPPIGGVPPAQPAPAKPPQASANPPAKLPPFELDLPKLGEGALAQPVEANKPTVAQSSPLSGERAAVVDVYPRDGGLGLNAKRGVTFVNKSTRDILLTVEGQTTTLPSKMVLSVEVPTKFTWQIGGDPERAEQVPGDASGLDVVIRN